MAALFGGDMSNKPKNAKRLTEIPLTSRELWDEYRKFIRKYGNIPGLSTNFKMFCKAYKDYSINKFYWARENEAIAYYLDQQKRALTRKIR